MAKETPQSHHQEFNVDQPEATIRLHDRNALEVVVYGAGGHSRVVADVLEDMGLEVASQLNDHAERVHPKTFNQLPGIRVLGIDDFPELHGRLVIAVGNNRERKELVELLADVSTDSWFAPLRYVTAVHSSALIAKTASVGEGSIILHGSIIQPNTKIGRHVLVNTAASIDHDNVISDYAHISPHVTLCGHVEVGEGSHVGAGATVIPSVKIGRWCTIGAGSVVLDDIPDGATAVGTPARIVERN